MSFSLARLVELRESVREACHAKKEDEWAHAYVAWFSYRDCPEYWRFAEVLIRANRLEDVMPAPNWSTRGKKDEALARLVRAGMRACGGTPLRFQLSEACAGFAHERKGEADVSLDHGELGSDSLKALARELKGFRHKSVYLKLDREQNNFHDELLWLLDAARTEELARLEIETNGMCDTCQGMVLNFTRTSTCELDWYHSALHQAPLEEAKRVQEGLRGRRSLLTLQRPTPLTPLARFLWRDGDWAIQVRVLKWLL